MDGKKEGRKRKLGITKYIADRKIRNKINDVKRRKEGSEERKGNTLPIEEKKERKNEKKEKQRKNELNKNQLTTENEIKYKQVERQAEIRE